jgi:hypothetical protein
MSATAPVRTYRVFRRARIMNRSYNPTAGEAQYFHAGPNISEGVLSSLERHGIIKPDFSEEGRADAAKQAKADAKPAATARQARENARADRPARDQKRSAATRTNTPQRARIEDAEANREKAEGSKGNKDGSVKPAKPGEAGATSDEPVGGDELTAFPGSGLPSDDPGYGTGNVNDDGDDESPAHDVNDDPPAEETNNPKADDDTDNPDFTPAIEPSKGLPSDDKGRPPVSPEFSSRTGAGHGDPPPTQTADKREAKAESTAAKGDRAEGKAKSSRLPADAKRL